MGGVAFSLGETRPAYLSAPPWRVRAAMAVNGLRFDLAKRIVARLGETPAPMLGDEAQLKQLAHNIVSNAMKYGHVDTPVTVELAREGRRIRLSVSDEGDGIAPDHLPRLTERFSRVDEARSRSVGGTGLGLAIVKHISERHQGQLDIESEVGKGTRVSVTFPLSSES